MSNYIVRVMPNLITDNKSDGGFAYPKSVSNKLICKVVSKFSDCVYTLPRQAFSFVVRLLSCRSPSAVARFVVPVYINSFNTQARLITRAFCPRFKRLVSQPFLANNNPSSPIRFVGDSVGIGATLFHAFPNSVQPTIRVSVFGQGFFASAWAAIQALRLLVVSAFKRLITPDTSESKVFSRLHSPTPKNVSDILCPKIGALIY